MIYPNDKSWGPWLTWCYQSKPDDIGDRRIQAVYINGHGDLGNDQQYNYDRHPNHHSWFSRRYPLAKTLAYRVEIQENN